MDHKIATLFLKSFSTNQQSTNPYSTLSLLRRAVRRIYLIMHEDIKTVTSFLEDILDSEKPVDELATYVTDTLQNIVDEVRSLLRQLKWNDADVTIIKTNMKNIRHKLGTLINVRSDKSYSSTYVKRRTESEQSDGERYQKEIILRIISFRMVYN